MPEEIAGWIAKVAADKSAAKDAGKYWSAETFLAQVLSWGQLRARYRPANARKEREATRVAGTSQKPRYGASQVAETAIDWATVRADAKDADDRQARRAAQAIRERDGVDPKAMAGAVAASLERFRPRPS